MRAPVPQPCHPAWRLNAIRSKVNRQENLCVRRANTKQSAGLVYAVQHTERSVHYVPEDRQHMNNFHLIFFFSVSGMCVRTHSRTKYERSHVKVVSVCVCGMFFNVTMRSPGTHTRILPDASPSRPPNVSNTRVKHISVRTSRTCTSKQKYYSQQYSTFLCGPVCFALCFCFFFHLCAVCVGWVWAARALKNKNDTIVENMRTHRQRKRGKWERERERAARRRRRVSVPDFKMAEIDWWPFFDSLKTNACVFFFIVSRYCFPLPWTHLEILLQKKRKQKNRKHTRKTTVFLFEPLRDNIDPDARLLAFYRVYLTSAPRPSDIAV